MGLLIKGGLAYIPIGEVLCLVVVGVFSAKPCMSWRQLDEISRLRDICNTHKTIFGRGWWLACSAST